MVAVFVMRGLSISIFIPRLAQSVIRLLSNVVCPVWRLWATKSKWISMPVQFTRVLLAMIKRVWLRFIVLPLVAPMWR